MIYRELGTTGMRVSPLGFGCMRLPMREVNGSECVDDDLAGPLLRRAVELGINFFDTHWFYNNYDSQRALGAALGSLRDKVFLSSKIHLMLVKRGEDYDDILSRALEKMQLEYLDCYHFPALSYNTWREKVLGLKLLDRAERAKARGLIRHISFSFHSDPEKIPELIDTGVFSTMLGQYNLVDRRNEEAFAYAKSKGVGTMVMGPLMGGVLTDGGQTFLDRMGSPLTSAAELGLRFVWSNPNIDLVLSGMSCLQQLEENVIFANRAADLTLNDHQALVEKSQALKDLNDLYCTSCNYCAVCPQNIRIGRIFQLYLQHSVWGLGEAVARRRGEDGAFGLPATPEACTECGLCSTRCPQGINIPEELKRVWPVLQYL